MVTFSKLKRFVFISFAVLAMAAVFVGCKTDTDDDPPVIGLDTRLIGTWDSGFDGYEITSDLKLYYYGMDPDTYTTGDDIAWGGKIVYAAKFPNNSGIIIIEYDTDKKQVWYDYSDYPSVTEFDPQPDGNFYGIYYDNLTAATVAFGNTSDQGNDYGPTETVTLQEAINQFTLDAKFDWMSDSSVVWNKVN